MSSKKTTQSKITKTDKDICQQVEDFLAVEAPLEIRLGHDKSAFQSFAITLCSPDNISDLIYGYLFTENIITSVNTVLEIDVFDNDLGLIAEVVLDQSIDIEQYLNKRQGMVHASCGVCGKTEIDDLLTYKYKDKPSDKAKFSTQVIKSLPAKLNQQQLAFTKTGGIHASALFDTKGELIFVREDIGRHNALDKLIGAALQKGLLPLSNHIVLLSGRVSFELVHKSLMAGISSIAAIGAPSSLSVEIANVNKLELFGFVKHSGYNQY